MRIAELCRTLPANQWMSFENRNLFHVGQATLAYDPDRQQFLSFGGGHCCWMGDEVHHYSVRANRWTISYPPDLPCNASYHMARTDRSFRDRPQAAVHTYNAIAYDQPSAKMLYLDWVYDVAEREWDPVRYPGLEHDGVMHSHLESTPQGVVCMSSKGLFRFEWKDKRWKKLPWNGPVKPERVWCDGGALCYDSKRDCLWFDPAPNGSTRGINRYDFKTGAVEKVEVMVPKWITGRKFALWRDPVYVPGADLLLIGQDFTKPDGTRAQLIFDLVQAKYYKVELPYEAGKAPDFTRWAWNVAQHYDARLGVVLKHFAWPGKPHLHVLKLDRATLKMTEIGE
jgi:hypothetical protein